MLKSIAVAVILAGAASSCSLGPKYSVYGADLESREGARVMAWAEDDAYVDFRCIVERKGEGADRIRSIQRLSGKEPLSGVGPIAGAAVMLPPGVTPAQRDAANQLLGEIAAYQPSMSTHLVVTAVEWKDVTDVKTVVERSREARDLMLPDGSTETPFLDLLRLYSPDLVVLPRADASGVYSNDFLVASSIQSKGLLFSFDPGNYEYTSTSAVDLADRVAARSTEAGPLRTALVLIPADADAGCRDACAQLLNQLLTGADDSWIIARRVTDAVDAAEFTEPAALQLAMPALVGFDDGLRGDPVPRG